MAEITEILTKLLDRTKEAKVPWQATSDDQTFVAHVGDSSVMVSKYRGNVGLRILDEAGREIDSLYGGPDSTDTTADEDADMNELFEHARRIALAVDSKLDELLKELG